MSRAALQDLHGHLVHRRRARAIIRHIAELVPRGASVLDVGSGDGLLAHGLERVRDDISIEGVDTLIRPRTFIPVKPFDGARLPYPDRCFDVVLLVDVVHHAEDPVRLLSEAARVAKRWVVLKDHTREGLLAGATLRFMDWVGNAGHGVSLPYNYWTEASWRTTLSALGLEPETWTSRLGLYPLLARPFFERRLHFITRLDAGDATQRGTQERAEASAEGASPEPTEWEVMYERFETPEEEVQKFTKRLVRAGAERWPRDSRVVELFCGRGNGLRALSRLGFVRLQGVDLSATLASRYDGTAVCHVADCRAVPLESGAQDVVIIQGGLHHLEALPDDLDTTLAEARRILREGGRIVVVEPWSTPFLSLVHACCKSSLLKALMPKLAALDGMIRNEARTYHQWLSRPEEVRRLLEEHFTVEQLRISWGKLCFVGVKRGTPGSRAGDGASTSAEIEAPRAEADSPLTSGARPTSTSATP